MNAILYYSNTGESKRIAETLAHKTQYALLDIAQATEYDFDNAVLVFPVYCQNIPSAVVKFIKTFAAKNLVAVATYGRMCHGNVLYEIQKQWRGNIIAAAYVPTKHAYLTENTFVDLDKLDAVINKFDDPQPITIPRSYKNIFSGFFPRLRSRIGVRLYKTSACDGCGVCNAVCAQNAIKNGKPNGNCIRCLKCVNCCPKNALRFTLRSSMRMYLKKKKKDELVIYV